MIDMASTGLRISSRLANKPRKKYGLFAKFSLAVIGLHDALPIFMRGS